MHIFSKSDRDLRTNFLREPFKSRGFPDYEMDWYGAPRGEYATETQGPDRQYPRSDPGLVGAHLFHDRGHEGGLCSGRARDRTIADESVPGDSVRVREYIYCPWHQWGFELATGTTAVKPEWSIRTYPVRVVGNEVPVRA